jgi:hypothetical protein
MPVPRALSVSAVIPQPVHLIVTIVSMCAAFS